MIIMLPKLWFQLSILLDHGDDDKHHPNKNAMSWSRPMPQRLIADPDSELHRLGGHEAHDGMQGDAGLIDLLCFLQRAGVVHVEQENALHRAGLQMFLRELRRAVEALILLALGHHLSWGETLEAQCYHRSPTRRILQRCHRWRCR
jgi:hypothetical protein